jgi:hypothetical protein
MKSSAVASAVAVGHNVKCDFKDIMSDKHASFTGNRIPLMDDLHKRA